MIFAHYYSAIYLNAQGLYNGPNHARSKSDSTKDRRNEKFQKFLKDKKTTPIPQIET